MHPYVHMHTYIHVYTFTLTTGSVNVSSLHFFLPQTSCHSETSQPTLTAWVVVMKINATKRKCFVLLKYVILLRMPI